jgi:non-specific protein-tyrosine kinase
MHRPRVHRLFHVKRRPGLSTLFIKPTIRLNGSLQATASDRLRVIGAGDMPLKPAEWLGSQKMREIMDAVLEQSDILILDTPPVLSVTDAVGLAPMVDGVLIVVRPGLTKMSALKEAVDQLRYVGAKIAGIVINGIDNRKTRYDDYYQQYQYYRTNGKPAQPKSPDRPSEHHWMPPKYERRMEAAVSRQSWP